jgi:hypothetical protein
MRDMLAGDAFQNLLIITNHSQQNCMKRSSWIYFSAFIFILVIITQVFFYLS